MVLEGALAFFVFSDTNVPVCHILSSNSVSNKKAIIVEANEWHAMTAAPKKLGTAVIEYKRKDIKTYQHNVEICACMNIYIDTLFL